MRELCLLGQWTNAAGLAAGAQWRPSAVSGGGELDTREMAEIKFIEIVAPVDPGPPIAYETLDNMYLVLDDEPTESYFRVSGFQSTLTTPMRRKVVNGMQIALGDDIATAMKGQRPLLDNTTLKYRSSVRPVFTAGTGAITVPFGVKLWGYRYTESDLLKILGGNATMPGSVAITDVVRERTFAFDRPAVSINWNNWDMLPGGPKQGKPSVQPYARFATNLLATTLNTPYQFRFETGMVASEEQDLYWNFDQKDKALLIKGIGVRFGTNLSGVALINTAEGNKEHPKGRILVSATDNPVDFGEVVDALAVGTDTFLSIPKFADTSYLIWKDTVYLAMWDTGLLPVAVGTVNVAVNGTLFEMK